MNRFLADAFSSINQIIAVLIIFAGGAVALVSLRDPETFGIGIAVATGSIVCTAIFCRLIAFLALIEENQRSQNEETRKTRLVVICLSLFFYQQYSAFASTVNSCVVISDDAARLACYDGYLKPLTQNHKQGEWRVSQSKSKIDDSQKVFLMVDSNDTYIGSGRRKHRPTLIIRCSENTTALYIDSDNDYLTDSSLTPRPIVRIDKTKAQKIDMAVSTDNQAIGLWSGRRSIPLLKRMLTAKSLLVQYTPVSDSPQSFTFNIAGLDKAIEPLRKTCNW